MNKERATKLLEGGASLGSLLILYQLLFGSFSIQTKNIIRDRARSKHKGQLASEVSHSDTGPFEAAHINHDKRNPNYDNPNNGILMTSSEHYDDHIKRHGRNGLHPLENIEALESLWDRLTTEQQLKRTPPYLFAQQILSDYHYNRWQMQPNKEHVIYASSKK